MFFNITLPAMRKRAGRTYRKQLGVYSYKLENPGYYKKPGVIPLNVKEKLKQEGTGRAAAMIKKMERESPYPYGQYTRKGKFMYDASKVPLYNVPDLSDFKLKPYVSVHTPQVDEETKKKLKALNNFLDAANFGRFSANPLIKSTQKPKLEKP